MIEGENMTIDLKKVEDTCCKLAICAGGKIIEIYEDKEAFGKVEYKADHSPLTLADTAANEIIVSGLKNAFPECAILSEEDKSDTTRREKEYCFIVDPLDGTKEFVNRNGEFTVNIALAQNGHPVVGVIYVPVTKELYYASQGVGTYYKQLDENLEATTEKKLIVSEKLEELIWVGSKSHSSEKEQSMIDAHEKLITDVKSAGSSLKGCMVARGEADVYYRFGLTCEWDTAAMQCVVEEAGGIFRQMDGTEMVYNRENTLNDKGFFIVNREENIWI